jgi:hypothetical protein
MTYPSQLAPTQGCSNNAGVSRGGPGIPLRPFSGRFSPPVPRRVLAVAALIEELDPALILSESFRKPN